MRMVRPKLTSRCGMFAGALAGLLLGLGMGLTSNVSGVVLAFYGLAIAVLLTLVAAIARRHDEHPKREIDD